MNITIITVGTRGDVQPYVALGIGLQEVGHTVTIATSKRFKTLITERGLPYAALSTADFLQLMETPEGRAELEFGKHPFRLLRELMPRLRQMLDDEWAAAQGAEAIIYHSNALSAYHMAEKLGVPSFLCALFPSFSPTQAFPHPILSLNQNLGGFFNKISYRAFISLATAPYHSAYNRWRQETLHLSPRPFMANDLLLHGQPVRKLYCYSPHVVSTPVDWDDSTTVTGYWFLNRLDNWKPPADLIEFLASGPPPVYVGFGSMIRSDSEDVSAIILAALQKSGQRGVLATGWGGISHSNVPDTVFVVESVPHDWLFPQMSAVVHHGGAGTTAAGLRAGRPTVICPFSGDQPFWGKCVYRLGVGPKPVAQKKLTVDRLAHAIHVATTDDEMRQRAISLGKKVRAEQGVARAVEIIGQQLSFGVG